MKNTASSGKDTVLLKKQKEIQKWEKQKARPKGHNYILYMLMIICLIYITDEIASQICVQMKTEIATDLFSKFGDQSAGKMSLLELVAYPFMGISLFYKTLSDRFGRKVFLIVNTLGMSLGMLAVFLSQNIVMYILGYCLISFFVPHDMQVVYIMETAPEKHRAKMYSAVKCVATLGVMLIPLFRKLFMPVPSEWRMVFLLPAVIGLVTALTALLLSRETDAFIDSRLKYLNMSEEELAKEKAAKDAQNAQGGFFKAFSFGMKHKQLRWLFILMSFHNLGFIITMHYQVMLSYGYAQNAFATGLFETLEQAVESVSINEITSALFMFPIGSALFQLAVGFISDKFGRKTAGATMSATTLITFIAFVLCAKNGVAPYITGFLTGACIGSFWAVGDINVMMMSESSPTNLRSSMLSACYVISAIGTVIGMGILLPIMNTLGNTVTSTAALFISAPGILMGLILVLTKTKETKNMNLDTVTGKEFD